MKADQSSAPAWSAGADRRFSASPLGAQILALLQGGSPSQRQLSDFILRNPVFVATHGIEDMARSSGISSSTISRYVRGLGLPGFGEFRAAVGDTVQALVAPVTKLIDRMAEDTAAEGAAAASLAAAARATEALLDESTTAALRRVSARLAIARHVWVMGFGLSAHLSAILTLGLQPYREGVANVVQFGGTEAAAARLMSAASGDVVIAIAFPRYSASVTDLARSAKSAGAHIVALTDSSAAPLALIADDILLAPAQHPILSSSSVPGLILIEALVSDFLLSDPAHLDRAAQLATAMSAYLASQV